MKELFNNLFAGRQRKHERYPIGAKGRKEYRDRQTERKLRVKVSPPYEGSRLEEYTVQTIKAASERPVNSRKRRLWLDKSERIDKKQQKKVL